MSLFDDYRYWENREKQEKTLDLRKRLEVIPLAQLPGFTPAHLEALMRIMGVDFKSPHQGDYEIILPMVEEWERINSSDH